MAHTIRAAGTADRVIAAIAVGLCCGEDLIDRDLSIQAQGFDSLDTMDALLEVEDALGISFHNNVAARLLHAPVKDWIDAVNLILNEKAIA